MNKLAIVGIPFPAVALAFVWPFTGTETVMVMTSVGAMTVSIIGAIKASEAKQAVNGHLLKLQNEQDKAKREREAEFDKLLQVVKDASRAEGEEIARKAAELLAAKVAEEVSRNQGRPAPNISHVAVPVVVAGPAPAAVAAAVTAPQSRIGDAIVELTAAAVETSEAADKTVDLAKKHPK